MLRTFITSNADRRAKLSVLDLITSENYDEMKKTLQGDADVFGFLSASSSFEDFHKHWSEYKSSHFLTLQSSEITGSVQSFLSHDALETVKACMADRARAKEGLN